MFKCTLKLLNEDEWLRHASKIISSNPNKSNSDLLNELFRFNFKFDTILDEPQASLTEFQTL